MTWKNKSYKVQLPIFRVLFDKNGKATNFVESAVWSPFTESGAFSPLRCIAGRTNGTRDSVVLESQRMGMR